MIVRVGGGVAFGVRDRIDLVKQRLIRHDRDNIIGVVIHGGHVGFTADLQKIAPRTRIRVGGIIGIFDAVATVCKLVYGATLICFFWKRKKNLWRECTKKK